MGRIALSLKKKKKSIYVAISFTLFFRFTSFSLYYFFIECLKNKDIQAKDSNQDGLYSTREMEFWNIISQKYIILCLLGFLFFIFHL